MKVTQLSLKMFLDSKKALITVGDEVQEKADAWLLLQKHRENGYGVDQDRVYYARQRLERALEDYRQQLAHTYDLMGDKGLVNFVPTGEYIAE